MSNISEIFKTLKENTIKKTIEWAPVSTGNGFLTATSKGSIRIEKNDFTKLITIRILNARGIEIENFGIPIEESKNSEFEELFNLIKRDVYQVDAQIESILSEIKESKPKAVNLNQFFPGVWKNTYTINNNTDSEFPVEIIDNKYFLQGKHWFDITNISVNDEKSILSFTKSGLGPDKRKLKNKLQIVNFGIEYTGTEVDENENNAPIHTVKYTMLL
jgi:hypothetical protein